MGSDCSTIGGSGGPGLLDHCPHLAGQAEHFEKQGTERGRVDLAKIADGAEVRADR